MSDKSGDKSGIRDDSRLYQAADKTDIAVEASVCPVDGLYIVVALRDLDVLYAAPQVTPCLLLVTKHVSRSPDVGTMLAAPL
jgi:hypothetical protein